MFIQNIPHVYSCEPLSFLELSTLKYPYYLINLQIVDENDRSKNIGKLKSFGFVVSNDEKFNFAKNKKKKKKIH